MSIPKEPRQLMINLMYLVYTALLALNVSAEVINAFFRIDNSIANTSSLIEASNTKVVESMEKTVEKKPIYKPLVVAAKEAKTIVGEFTSFIDEVRDKLEKTAGGTFTPEENEAKAGWPKKYKDKDIPTRMFVVGYPKDGRKALGPQIKAKIEETRQKLLDLVKRVGTEKIEGTNITEEKVQALINQLSLKVDDSWKKSKKKSWSEFYFGHMPVAAVYPILRQFQGDAKNSEANIINFLAKQIGATTIEFDKFEAVASSPKGYILQGETYEADIFLSAFSSQAKNGISIKVNGKSIPIKDGKGHYKVTPTSTGEKEYNVDIYVTNPITKKTDKYSKKFKYEVGKPSAVTVSADKMNVFYIGVDNPVSIAGVAANKLKVSATGATIRRAGNKFNVTATKPGEARITVSGGDIKPTSFKFRVKRIPDPVAQLGKKKGGTIGNGTFKAFSKIWANLENFDFEARCKIQGFEFTYVAKRQDPVLVRNSGGKYNEQVRRLAQKAKPGDIYYFDNVKARCPGDIAGRLINSMVFKIK